MKRFFRKKNIYMLLTVYFVFAVISSVTPYASFASDGYSEEILLRETCFKDHSASGTDRARVVADPAEALNIRLELIRAAKKNIDIVCHCVERSCCIDAILGEILEAAEWGVRVRILINGKNNPSSVPALKALNTHGNISCRWYNPMNLLTPWNWNGNLHDKFMVVDGEYLLLGGRNLNERHFAPDDFKGELTNDLDVFVWKADEYDPETPGALTQIREYMELLWNCEAVKNISAAPMEGKKADGYLEELRSAVHSFKESNPRFYAGGLNDYLDETVPTLSITLIHNPIHTSRKDAVVYNYLKGLMESAGEKIIIQTPYATGNKTLLADFASIEVKLVMQTNSPLSTPNYPAFSNYYYQRDKFLDADVLIYEYQGTDSQHGKSLVIDNRTAVIGSFNFDDRSMYINTEVMLVIDGPYLANQLDGVLEEQRRNSLQVGSDNTYLPREDVLIREVPWTKMLLLRIIYIFLRPFQFLI